MAKPFAERFAVTYESVDSHSFLLVSAGNEKRVISYQIEMLRHNPADCRIPLELRNKNGQLLLYYNVTAKLPLSFFIKRHKLSKELYRSLLIQIADTVLGCGGLLLNKNNFILEQDFIYIRPADKRVSLIYLPAETEMESAAAFKALASGLFMEIDGAEAPEAEDFLQQLLKSLKADDFSIKGMRALLAGTGGRQAAADEEELCGCERKSVPKAEAPQEAARTKKEYGPSGKGGRLNNYMPAGALQLVILLLAVFTHSALKTAGLLNSSNYAGILLLLAAADLLIVRLLLRRPGGASSSEEKKELPLALHEKEAPAPGVSEAASGPDSLASPPPDTLREAGNNGGRCETMVLSGAGYRYPVLMGINDGIPEEIHIIKEDFVIGRLEAQVDHVSRSPALGKLHARITCRDGHYHITDLNSRNGCFINGSRLDGCMEYKINNGDRISLANRDYTFIMPKSS